MKIRTKAQYLARYDSRGPVSKASKSAKRERKWQEYHKISLEELMAVFNL